MLIFLLHLQNRLDGWYKCKFSFLKFTAVYGGEEVWNNFTNGLLWKAIYYRFRVIIILDIQMHNWNPTRL